MGYVASTLEYIGSSLVYVGYIGSTLGYVGCALACIAFSSILVNNRSTLGYFWSIWSLLEVHIESTLGYFVSVWSMLGYDGSALACIAFYSILVNNLSN